LCVAATYGALQATSAEASQTVIIKSGDSISRLARQHNVSVKDIARANGISEDAVLAVGKKLVIPDPPKTVVRPPTMRRAATTRGNRIAVRRGPFEGYRRITLLDDGAPLVVTRRAGDWFQVELATGQSGWVRQDFVALKDEAKRTALASANPRATKRIMAASSERKAVKRRQPQTLARAETHRSKRRAQIAQHKETRQKITRIARSRQKTRLAAKSRRATRSATLARRQARPEAGTPNTGSDVVRTAYAYRGVRYRYGGSSRGGFDCSGFTSHIYRARGIKLPHSSSEQFKAGRKVSSSELKPGDLVFFSTTRRGISHVGIYAGEGKFIHASSAGGSVRVDTLRSGYYRNRFRGARRIQK